ncbi:hypothetical protein ATANTOWER_000093 [Ataeniobius toweri]|uniref:Secreted protein n=1 Tax=Ataeniobius toweri TaxID=208326 RepID=A0ABU7BVU7_9TELE|nr:hypothetical protein [Ataeniobius toweri]
MNATLNSAMFVVLVRVRRMWVTVRGGATSSSFQKNHVSHVHTAKQNQCFDIFLLWDLFLKMITFGLPKRHIGVDATPKQQNTFVDTPKLVSGWTGPKALTEQL